MGEAKTEKLSRVEGEEADEILAGADFSEGLFVFDMN